MTCDTARELLFDQQEGLLDSDERAALREHLHSCEACRAEEAALKEAYGALAQGVRGMAASVTPSPAFWQSLSAGLDAVDADADAERQAERARRRRPFLALVGGARRRWVVTAALLAALLAGLVGSGGAQHAWAALSQWLSCVPVFGICQVAPSALVAAGQSSYNNGTATLTVTGLVSGRQTTLLAYRLSGRGLALAVRAGAPVVADAVEVAMIDAKGRRYNPRSWLPIQTGVAGGVPYVQGMLSFPALARDAGSVRLVAARLPLAPVARPWTVTLHLSAAGSGAAETALALNRSAMHSGIAITATDVVYDPEATIVDMTGAITSGPYRGASIVSLTPEQAVGGLAPVLAPASGGKLGALISPLPAPVRLSVLMQPEFVFPAVRDRRALALIVPAVAVQEQAAVAVVARAGERQPRTVALGSTAITITGARVVTPPPALGLGNERRLRLTLAFPPARPAGTLDSVDVVVDGVGHTLGRDNPQLELPLNAGQQTVRLTMESPVVSVRGPWTISLTAP